MYKYCDSIVEVDSVDGEQNVVCVMQTAVLIIK